MLTVGEDLEWADTEGMLEWVVGELADSVVPLPQKYAAMSEQVRQQWLQFRELDPVLADRIWETHEIESNVMNARVKAAARLAGPVQKMMAEALLENWPRKRLLKAMSRLVEEYASRYAFSPELRTGSDGQSDGPDV